MAIASPHLPPGFHVLAQSENAPFALIADESAAFLRHAVPSRSGAHAQAAPSCCAISRKRSLASRRLEHARVSRRGRAARSASRSARARVICGLSGGVDSAVAAVLIHEAIGDQLTCIFVDTGLMRAGEARGSRVAVPRPLQHSADPCERERAVPVALAGVTDPEQKRKIIGATVHRCVRRTRRRRSAAPNFWRRARSIRT